MPGLSPVLTEQCSLALSALGDAVRARRKTLRVSATATAEAAGISRVTLHRIEKGEPSVTVGAYIAVFAALGLEVHAVLHGSRQATAGGPLKGWIPARIPLDDYPQLKELAWQVHGTSELTPREALDIYERNGRHLDPKKLSPDERELIDALRLALAGADV